jgi:methionine sulfoxide reductase catalytic subunit
LAGSLREHANHFGPGQTQTAAKRVVFYSLGEGADRGIYYDAHPIEHISHHLTMLAYDMTVQPSRLATVPPLRLRNEVELGFKQFKWVKGIGFVAHFSEVGSGYGG